MTHLEQTRKQNHALSRKQSFNRVQANQKTDPFYDPYWTMFDQEIQIRREHKVEMYLSAFATFFTLMENRYIQLVKDTIETYDDMDVKNKLARGFTQFVDSFEDRYKQCISRYTDLYKDEHQYAWLCLIHVNRFNPEALLLHSFEKMEL